MRGPRGGALVRRPTRMTRHAARALLGLNAGFWIAAAAAVTLGFADVGIADQGARTLLVSLMVLNGLLLGAFTFLVHRGRIWIDAGAFALVSVNLVLTPADQIGAVDGALLLLNAAALALIAYHLWYQRRTM